MLIAYWIVAGLLALAFLFSGAVKLVRSREQVIGMGMRFAEDFSSPVVKLIGAAEVLGAIGLVLPPLTGIAPVLAPIAAIGLGIIMIGAVVVHVRRSEPPIPNVVLLALAIASAVLGFLVWV